MTQANLSIDPKENNATSEMDLRKWNKAIQLLAVCVGLDKTKTVDLTKYFYDIMDFVGKGISIDVTLTFLQGIR